ncbi:MAG: DUF4158 domain-containing protein [Acidimicrobiales bacterium]
MGECLAPLEVVDRLVEHRGIAVSELSSYGTRTQTRTDHLVAVAKFLGWCQVSETMCKELDQFLVARILEHDPPALSFRLACEYLRSAQLAWFWGPPVCVPVAVSATALVNHQPRVEQFG